MVQLLLSYGANPNTQDNWKFSPLHEAAIKGKADVCIGEREREREREREEEESIHVLIIKMNEHYDKNVHTHTHTFRHEICTQLHLSNVINYL